MTNRLSPEEIQRLQAEIPDSLRSNCGKMWVVDGTMTLNELRAANGIPPVPWGEPEIHRASRPWIATVQVAVGVIAGAGFARLTLWALGY